MRESDESEGTFTPPSDTRRDFLYVATGMAATVGTLATLWPFIVSMRL